MTRTLTVLIAALGLALAPLGPSATADDPKPAPRQVAADDLKKLQGTWECVAMEREGEPIPPESLKGSTAVYDGDLVTLYREGEVFRRGVVTLDPSRSPRRVNTWDQDGPYADQTVPGIYDVDGDTLKLCFAHPNEDRPTKFSSKDGGGYLLCTYKRKKP